LRAPAAGQNKGMSLPGEKVLIVGIGNELLGDEGLGVHVARSLLGAKASLPPQVEVLDAGTALLDLLPEMSRYSRVILVDAVRAGQEAGRIYRLESLADFAGQLDTNPRMSLHQWDLMETLRVAEMLGLLPKKLSLVGAEPESIAPGTELSPKLTQAAEKIVSILLDEASSTEQGNW